MKAPHIINKTNLKKEFDEFCNDSALGSEWSFHQLSPYIGKIKSSIARFLIQKFTDQGDTIYDPFCGAGTIPLEAWSLGRNVVANDLNKYAFVLTQAKLLSDQSLDSLINEINEIDKLVNDKKKEVDLRKISAWVRAFFHPETLRELVAWFNILDERRANFLQGCLLGILHHQRPGFLSFPSSHTVPYLRVKKFPISQFPDLYKYRSVKDRLTKKVQRAFKKMPDFDNKLSRMVYNKDASTLHLTKKIDAVISSPPYMRQLDYARDNRLRLWFLNIKNYKELDYQVSPKESDFIETMSRCLLEWKHCLKKNGKCILFLGDNYSKKYKMFLPDLIENIATKEVGGYTLIFKHQSIIPNNRRIRRGYKGNKMETILVFNKI